MRGRLHRKLRWAWVTLVFSVRLAHHERRRTPVALQQLRSAVELRARERRLAARGLTYDRYLALVAEASNVWQSLFPWRSLPRRVRRRVCARFAGPFIGRYIAAAMQEGAT